MRLSDTLTLETPPTEESPTITITTNNEIENNTNSPQISPRHIIGSRVTNNTENNPKPKKSVKIQEPEIEDSNKSDNNTEIPDNKPDTKVESPQKDSVPIKPQRRVFRRSQSLDLSGNLIIQFHIILKFFLRLSI